MYSAMTGAPESAALRSAGLSAVLRSRRNQTIIGCESAMRPTSYKRDYSGIDVRLSET